MSAMKVVAILLGGLVLCALMGGCAVYNGYNTAIAMDEEVKSSWAQVDNQLQRRFDLIPNLIETVKGVAKQEEKIYLGVAKSREAYFQSKTVADKAKAAGSFESALSRLLVLRETYPQLRSNESFMKFQDTLEGTENRLSVERKRYNDSVKRLNTFTRQLLGRLYANLAGVGPAEYFEIEEAAKAVPKVNFTD